MRIRRKIAIAALTVTCTLAVSACGEQIAAHVSAGDSVHAALTSVFNSHTTRFVITAENLPGKASIADGSFSIVVTTSKESGQSASSSTGNRSVDISIYHESTNLMDIREVDGTEYFRLDLKDISAFGGAGSYARIASELNKLAASPGLSYFHDILVGNWVGISTKTVVAFTRQLEHSLAPTTVAPTIDVKQLRMLTVAIDTSLIQSIRTWLSIHQIHAGEYSLNLPIRGFVGSFVRGIIKPLESFIRAYTKVPLPPGEITQGVGKAIDRIPAGLSVHANLWVQSGSMSRLQIFIPDSPTSVMIGISHPASPVQAPNGATILTMSSLTALYKLMLPGGLGGSGLSGGLGSSLGV